MREICRRAPFSNITNAGFLISLLALTLTGSSCEAPPDHRIPTAQNLVNQSFSPPDNLIGVMLSTGEIAQILPSAGLTPLDQALQITAKTGAEILGGVATIGNATVVLDWGMWASLKGVVPQLIEGDLVLPLFNHQGQVVGWYSLNRMTGDVTILQIFDNVNLVANRTGRVYFLERADTAEGVNTNPDGSQINPTPKASESEEEPQEEVPKRQNQAEGREAQITKAVDMIGKLENKRSSPEDTTNEEIIAWIRLSKSSLLGEVEVKQLTNPSLIEFKVAIYDFKNNRVYEGREDQTHFDLLSEIQGGSWTSRKISYISGYAFKLKEFPTSRILMLDSLTAIGELRPQDIKAIWQAGYAVILDPYGNYLTLDGTATRVIVILTNYPLLPCDGKALYPSLPKISLSPRPTPP